MFKAIKELFGTRSELSRFKKSPESDREIVFYAEGAQDWPHFEASVRHLTRSLGQRITYVTSQPDDPVLERKDPNLVPYCIGSGALRTLFFQGLDCKVLVMTMPELEASFIKRSHVAQVHYVYLFHAINSTHMVYQTGAFDGYDSVLCVGPHHCEEIRKTEQVYDLPAKKLIEHGYGRLDALIAEAEKLPAFRPGDGAQKNVLLASSWGVGSVIELPEGRELIRALLAADHRLTVRLHPMTVRRFPDLAGELEAEFSSHASLRVETNMHSQQSLHESDIMISDWSGAGSEYAFALERPVLYIDTPPKVNNPEFARLDLPPLEDTIRREIGDVLPLDAINSVNDKIRELTADPDAFRDRIVAARERLIFNNGRSGEVAGDYIHGLLKEPAHESGEDQSAGGAG